MDKKYIKRKDFFIEQAEKHIANGFTFSYVEFEQIKRRLVLEGEDFAVYAFEEIKDALVEKGYYYCHWEDAVGDKEYAKEMDLIEE